MTGREKREATTAVLAGHAASQIYFEGLKQDVLVDWMYRVRQGS